MNEFEQKLSRFLPAGLLGAAIDTLQVNLGRRCNLACRHCHLDCSSERTEMMSSSTMQRVLETVRGSRLHLVDLTGGSPELHPGFRELVAALCDMGQAVQVRTNFAALLEPELDNLIQFLGSRQVQLVGSLPCYLEENVRAQRGPGTYEKSVTAIRRLNDLGYGIDEDLPLNLVYNPGGPSLPGGQADLEKAYREELGDRLGLRFTHLLVITNMPIGRFGRELERDGKTAEYRRTLREAFNPTTLENLMCRHQVCVDWDGKLYDCDFNIALGMTMNHGAPSHIEAFDSEALVNRRIVTGTHCFGCTAGSGSSCGGALV